MTRRTLVRWVVWAPITIAGFTACTYLLVTY